MRTIKYKNHEIVVFGYGYYVGDTRLSNSTEAKEHIDTLIGKEEVKHG